MSAARQFHQIKFKQLAFPDCFHLFYFFSHETRLSVTRCALLRALRGDGTPVQASSSIKLGLEPRLSRAKIEAGMRSLSLQPPPLNVAFAFVGILRFSTSPAQSSGTRDSNTPESLSLTHFLCIRITKGNIYSMVSSLTLLGPRKLARSYPGIFTQKF